MLDPLETPGGKLSQAVELNPDLATDPVKAATFTQDPSIDANTSARAAKFGSMMEAAGPLVKSGAHADPQESSGPGFFGHLIDAAKDVGSSLSGRAAWETDASRGVASGIEGGLHELSDATTRGINTGTELASAGRYSYDFDGGIGQFKKATGPAPGYASVLSRFFGTGSPDLFGVGPPSQAQAQQTQNNIQINNAKILIAKANANPTPENVKAANDAYTYAKEGMAEYGPGTAWANVNDAYQTVNNLSPQNLLLGKNNVFFMMAHTAAYTESLAAKKGWAYALGQLTPALAIGVLTDGALGAGMEVGSAEYDADLLASSERLEAAGGKLSDENLRDVQLAQARTMQRQLQTNYAQQIDEDAASNVSDATENIGTGPKKAFNGAIQRGIYKGADAASRVISPVVQLGKNITAPATDLRMNIMYQMAQQQALGNADDQALWNQTSDLQARDANGKQVGQDGTALLKMMDVDPHSMWFSPLSDVAGLANFYTKWLGTDPVGAVGGVIGQARTAEGLSGTLGKWFSGLSISDRESMAVAAQQYPRVARAVVLMSHMDVADLSERFPGTFNARQMLDIEKLTTPEQVINYLGDEAEAGRLARPLAPSMSPYDELKMRLHQYTSDHAVMTPQDYRFALDIAKTPEELKAVGLDPEQTAAQAGMKDSMVNARVSLGRWFATRLDASPMYFDEDVGRMVHAVFNPASDNAIKAEMGLARVALFPENLTRLIAHVAAESTPAERNILFDKLSYFATARRMTAGLDTAITQELQPTMMKMAWEKVQDMVGLDESGSAGAMVVGDPDLSETYDLNDPNAGAKISAVRTGQLATKYFPNPRSLRGLAVMSKKIASTVPTELVDRSILFHASDDMIHDMAGFLKPAMGDVRHRLEELADTPERDVIGRSRDATAGYRAALGEAHEMLDAHAATEGIDSVTTYTNAFNMVRQRALDLEHVQSLVGERDLAIRTYPRGSSDLANEMARINGELPTAIGIGDITQMNPAIVRRLTGQVAAFNSVGRIFADQLSEDNTYYDDIVQAEKDYQKHVLENPNAPTEVTERYARLFAEAAQKNSKFLNPWQRSVDWMNQLLSRTWVPAALFSGAWSFHIAVSEGTLNTMRNGFGNTYDSMLLSRIAKHASGETMYGGILTRLTDKMINDGMTVNDSFLARDEGGHVAKVVTKALHSVDSLQRAARFLGAGYAIDAAHQAVSGTIMGFERMALAGMDNAQRLRMMDDFVDEVVNQDGGLPNMRINHVGSTFSGDGKMNTAGKKLVYGIADNGAPTVSHMFVNKSFHYIDSDSPGYVTALHDVLRYQKSDEIEGPLTKQLYDRVYAAGKEGLTPEQVDTMDERAILKRGATNFRTDEQFNALQKELEDSALEKIKAIRPEDRARFDRSSRVLSSDKAPLEEDGSRSEDPLRHWAHVAAHDVTHSVSGIAKAAKETSNVIHPDLLSQFGDHEVDDVQPFAKKVAELDDGTEPKNIPSRDFVNHKGLEYKGLDHLHFINTLSDFGHQYIFGPIANNLVRDPLYLLEYHLEMERLRALPAGYFTKEEMVVQAETNASMKMIRFVHNPLDKMVIEENMRVVAPFYFAQNQAIRRAFRLMHDDPGAFEKYLKMSLGVTNWVSASTKNGTEPLIHIPGSQVVGWMASKFPANLGFFHNPFAHELFNNLGFSISGSPGSVSSMVPTGAIGGVNGILGNITRPSWGPLLTMPAEAAEALGKEIPWMQQLTKQILAPFIHDLLGPNADNAGMAGQIDPSSVFRATEALIEGTTNPTANASFMSTYLLTMQNGADNLYSKFVDQATVAALKKYTSENGKPLPNTAKNRELLLHNGAAARFISGEAGEAFSKWMSQPSNYQNFLHDAKAAAVTMSVAKVAATLGSPFAPSVQETFSKIPEFEKILASTVTKTNPNGAYYQAVAKFTAEYPSHYLDLASRSTDIYGPWPETKETLDFTGKYPDLVKKYPYAAAFLMNPNKPYDINGYSALTSLGFRQQDTPQEFITAMNVKAGEEYYDNVLKPEYGTNYSGLKQAAIKYGVVSNPAWLASHSGAQYVYDDGQELSQMDAMVNDKSVSNAVFGGGNEREGFKWFVDYTKQAVKEYGDKTTNSQREEFAYNWYNTTAALAKNPEYAKYASFITNVMAGILDRSNL